MEKLNLDLSSTAFVVPHAQPHHPPDDTMKFRNVLPFPFPGRNAVKSQRLAHVIVADTKNSADLTCA